MALGRGQARAEAMLRAGLIAAAYLGLKGRRLTVLPDALSQVA